MSANVSRLTPDRRRRLLRAFDLTPWQLRSTGMPAPVAGVVAPVATADCAVVVPADCTARQLDLLGRVFNAYGVALARAGRIRVAEGHLAGAVPQVRAYLVFGQGQAQALGRELPASTLQQAQIVLVDEPAQVLAEASAKRRLWLALRQLRRALTASAGG